MRLLLPPQLSSPFPCSYLNDQQARYEFFYATDVGKGELDFFLEQGMRRFGSQFFRPSCYGCSKCLPLRIDIAHFSPKKDQKRTLRKNSDITLTFSRPIYQFEIYKMYLDHNQSRFETPAMTEDEFKETFFDDSPTAVIGLYFLGERLIACGFLDQGEKSLSAVYFFYDPLFAERSLGTFGALCEIEYAKKSNLTWYYLGYGIHENSSMAYKFRYGPHQIYNWQAQCWEFATKLT